MRPENTPVRDRSVAGDDRPFRRGGCRGDPDSGQQVSGAAMSDSEFSLIARYFAEQPVQRADVVAGIGDDAAVLSLPAGQELVVSVDTLVSGCHFAADDPPAAVGHKTLAVSLSDLAAMGARPAWATLALTLPEFDERWLEGFSRGLFALAKQHAVVLVGGDTTRGPLSVSLQIHGFVPSGTAIRRQGAHPGDDLYVTGFLGDAALALQLRQAGREDKVLAERLDRPEPRVAFGERLRGLATAAIDISDGLLADLGHLLDASQVGATLSLAALPQSPALQTVTQDWREEARLRCLLAGGDDYELCFTAPPSQRQSIHRLAERSSLPVSRVGTIVSGAGLQCRRADGSAFPLPAWRGYDHFAPS